jgi:hypothetical protein
MDGTMEASVPRQADVFRRAISRLALARTSGEVIDSPRRTRGTCRTFPAT